MRRRTRRNLQRAGQCRPIQEETRAGSLEGSWPLRLASTATAEGHRGQPCHPDAPLPQQGGWSFLLSAREAMEQGFHPGYRLPGGSLPPWRRRRPPLLVGYTRAKERRSSPTPAKRRLWGGMREPAGRRCFSRTAAADSRAGNIPTERWRVHRREQRWIALTRRSRGQPTGCADGSPASPGQCECAACASARTWAIAINCATPLRRRHDHHMFR